MPLFNNDKVIFWKSQWKLLDFQSCFFLDNPKRFTVCVSSIRSFFSLHDLLKFSLDIWCTISKLYLFPKSTCVKFPVSVHRVIRLPSFPWLGAWGACFFSIFILKRRTFIAYRKQKSSSFHSIGNIKSYIK